ncbi:phage holin family protein [Tropicimonas sp. TH_r6]|uniref:phage holin family protein n=1 Tax=Tropicimonas sp. TH_r6 TaxID=3082085 RepID=UPI002954DB84|nr:phage holin family protein [Tropicimonas sp. TH_r6]MDV7144522.1 phage holin family protein [Tropicimonas sp. TH_r6]
MSRLSRNIQIILRSERLIRGRQARVALRQTGFLAVAAVLGAIALVFLNIAAYQALATLMRPSLAALSLAGINVALAGILIAVASRLSAEREIEAVSEVRDMAVEDLEQEILSVTGEARELAQNVRRMAENPISTAGLSVMAPLLSAILKSLHHSPAQKGRDEAAEE